MSNEVNAQYRDRLFKFIFGNPAHKAWTLSLYNAVNGSRYTDENAIEINTIEDAVYLGMKNDVSFLINDTLNLYEQQSTFNPNMPMRFLIYAGMLYDKYVRNTWTYRIYSSSLQKAPAPKFVCFYNGAADKEDRVILKLSDSFDKESVSDIEVTVTMLNINYGHNQELLNACKPLYDYSWFVYQTSEKRRRGMELNLAIDEALNELPDNSTLKKFLMDNKAEVKRMCITEYDQERVLAQQREEGRLEGRVEGLIEEKKNTAEKLRQKGWSVEEIADLLGVPAVDVEVWLASK